MRRLDELYHEAALADLVYPGVVYTKEALMQKLATYYHKQKDGILLPQLPIMLARNVKDITTTQLDQMMNSQDYVAEEKLDELRAKLHLGANEIRVDTRHRSDVTYTYNERTLQLPHLRNMTHDMEGTVLDGGLQSPVKTINYGKTQTDSWLTSTTAIVNSSPERAIELQKHVGDCFYYVWDILFYCGQDVRNWTYEKRYHLLCTIRHQLSPQIIKMPTRCLDGFESFYKAIVAGGGEGIMLKHLYSPYVDAGPGGSRRPKAMYKMKKQKELDGFISGFTRGEGEFTGLVGSLLISVYDKDGEVHEVAAVQPGEVYFRKAITVPGTGELIPKMYGKVVQISYLCTTKNHRCRHAVLERFRPDKESIECNDWIN